MVHTLLYIVHVMRHVAMYSWQNCEVDAVHMLTYQKQDGLMYFYLTLVYKSDCEPPRVVTTIHILLSDQSCTMCVFAVSADYAVDSWHIHGCIR